MPDLVMEIIMKYAGFKSVLTLRKVSRSLRNYIDNSPDWILLDANLTSLDIKIRLDSISIIYRSSNFFGFLEYSVVGSGKCKRIYNGKIEKFENVDLVEMAVKDLKLVMRFRKFELKSVMVDFDFDPEIVGELMEDWLGEVFDRGSLKSESLILKVSNQNQVMSILPYFSPKRLKKLGLEPSQFFMRTCFLETDQITKTDQWKNVKVACIQYLRLKADLKSFAQIQKGYACIRSISWRDLDFLKNAFTRPESHFLYLCIEYDLFVGEDQLSMIWGPPRITGTNNKFWYFAFLDFESEDVLEVYWPTVGLQMTISRIESNEVPREAVIQYL